MKSLLVALSFLTVIPVNFKEVNENTLKNSIRYYPVVGLFLGIFFYFITFLNFNIDLTTLLILISCVAITGGFHLDGLADIADALGALKDREKTFEIMKDSRIGAMGTIAIALSLLLKFVLIKNVLLFAPALLVLTPVCGRYSIVFLSKHLNYAKEKGLGKFIADNTDFETYITASIFLLLVTIILKQEFVFTIFFFYIFLIMLSSFFYKKFNGVTGDMLGASVELSEILIMFTGVLIAGS